MNRVARIEVAPSVMVWARETAGLSQEEAARRLSVSLKSLQRWEKGELAPTIGQLRKAAKRYGRPLPVLLLAEAPSSRDSLPDFRRLAGPAEGAWSPELHREFKRALMQREVLLELADTHRLDGGSSTTPPPPLSLKDAPEDAATELRRWLEVAPPTDRVQDGERRLREWIGAAENRNILVIHTDRVDVAEMRGFSISERPYPVIALNGSDTRRGRLFTLAHELVHISLRKGGMCDLHEVELPLRQKDAVEQYSTKWGRRH